MTMKQLIIKLSALLLATIALVACEKSDNESLVAEYGYVQFKVVKQSASTSDASRATLESLADAYKLTVVMQHKGSTITQTLLLSSYDSITAEWGVRSEKLRLLVGSYDIIGYYLYDNMDKELLTGGGCGSFMVEAGGLTLHNIATDVVSRGMVEFMLCKELTRAEEGCYDFSTIRRVDITVRHSFTQKSTTFKSLPVSYEEYFEEGSTDEELYPNRNRLSSRAVCDTTLWVEAGNYTITGYTTYSDNRASSPIESRSIEELEATFSVTDNTITRDVAVPVLLSESADHIKDYLALKEIWLALDGPNWSYYGEEYQAGANWNFNKDVDMWGDQPGVTLDGSGRVVNLNLSGFGAEGVVPEAIGQLTELCLLYLGNHNELIGGYAAGSSARIDAMDYHNKVLSYDAREDLSPELKRVINSDATQRPILSSRIEKKDVAFGNLTNGITGISRAVMRLTKLEQFFIANAPITYENFICELEPNSIYTEESASWSWANFSALTDVEIYNCPKLKQLPTDILCSLPNIQSLNLAMNQNISGEQLKADWEAIIDGESGDNIQILYLGYNNLVETPSHDYLKRMSKLGLLDCTNNRLERVHPFGKEVALTTVYLDNNRIESLYAAEDGYFCSLNQLETFSCSGNRLTELPDIFTARSIYSMLSANFSYNNIASLQNGDAWRGVNTATLNLAANRLEEMPMALLGSGSRIETLMLSGNGMRKIAEGAFTNKYSASITTIDLSYNKLSELPYGDFSAENLPYLYGIDLSSNSFSEFPYAPLSIATLTVMSIRQQRDEAGNRTLREWPTGLYQCPKMAAFYIGSNDLRKIEDTISPYILLFEIKDNPNISIDLSSVCAYIEMGYYQLIYDSTQDIRGCDALNLD